MLQKLERKIRTATQWLQFKIELVNFLWDANIPLEEHLLMFGSGKF